MTTPEISTAGGGKRQVPPVPADRAAVARNRALRPVRPSKSELVCSCVVCHTAGGVR